jgi:hypothetical protein
MVNSDPQIRNGAGKRCAFCDGRFGLIRHHSGRVALCSKKCAERYKARRENDRNGSSDVSRPDNFAAAVNEVAQSLARRSSS